MKTSLAVSLRRGLPRRPGEDAWPVVDGPVDVDAARTAIAPPIQQAPVPADQLEAAPQAAAPAAAPAEPQETQVQAGAFVAPAGLRRGLPRVAGGEPWPQQPAGLALAAGPSPALAPESASQTQAEGIAQVPAPVEQEQEQAPVPQAPGPQLKTEARQHALRQGLPRRDGEAHWPLAAEAQVLVAVAEQPATVAQDSSDTTPATLATAPAEPEAAEVPAGHRTAEAPVGPTAKAPAQQRSPLLSHPMTKIAAGVAALVVIAGLAVLVSRWFLGSGTGQSFIGAYPGEYHLPENAPVGFPAWLGWQHFLNVFLMVLIIRSGLQIRGEKRPTAYWTSKRRKDGKVSLTIWFHQSMDLLWLVNGALFIVLLFASGQWMRVVPTSWEVFPNALSAALQYMSLDWPTENGWVNYNSLQQLAYFTTIFVAAPLAAATGYRMSGMWPKKAEKLSRIYPMELARKLHFPVMIYFVAFILIHVLLVVSTGALRNLNHMYGAQGSVDPTEFADNWFGFWMFVASLAVMVGAVLAARPFVLAPIASLFGKVSSR